MASVTCLHHGCRRKVAENSEWGYYCYDHRMFSPEYAEVIAGSVEMANQIGHHQPVLIESSDEAFHADIVQTWTPIAGDLTEPYLNAAEEWNADRDMTVPAEAGKRHNDAHDEFRELLIKNGVSPSRIDVIEVRGLNRMIPASRNPIQSDHRIYHKVLLVDKDTKHEVVIDPTISMFAPVRQTDQPVDDQLDSGLTPFGDSPWIGTREEYVSGDYMWWDEAE